MALGKGKSKSSYKRQKRRRASSGRAARFGRIVLFVVAVILLVLPVLVLADPVSYVPLIMAVLIVFVSWIYLQILKHSLTISISQMADSCERGAQVGLVVNLANSSPLPFSRIDLRFFISNLFGEVDGERILTCSLSPFESTQVVFDASFPHLGTYRAGISSVVIHDLLGIFESKRQNGAMDDIIVRPAKVDLMDAGVNQVMPDESNHAMKPIASDNEDYAGVREYRRGDPLKTVHWNLSARTPQGTMYTRLFEEYVNPSLVIIIDPYSPRYDSETLMSLFDGMVETAAALSAQSRIAGIDAEVRYIDKNQVLSLTHIATEDDTDDLVENMLKITPETTSGTSVETVEEALRSAGLQTHGFGNVALITSRTDPDCLSALVDIRMRKRNSMIFVAVPRSLEGPDRQKFWAPVAALGSAGIAHYAVESTVMGTEVIGL